VPQTDVDTLLAEVTRQAEAERGRLLAEARRQVEEARGRTAEEIRRLEEEAARHLESRLAADRSRIIGRLRMEERNRMLELRREAIRRAFEQAGRRLAEGGGSREEYRRLLRRLIGEAVREVGGAADLQVARGDKELARTLAREMGLDCAVRGEGEEPGTVVASTGDGLRRVDNSLATRLRTAERVLEQEVSRLLFGGSPAADG
jgi:vacuolar-type H+-ATPase subunit E/Vma4